MKIYNVLINDRHCDPIIHNFSELDVALDFARQNAGEYCRFPEDMKEESYDPDRDDGWILNITTSCEGDNVRVSVGELK